MGTARKIVRGVTWAVIGVYALVLLAFIVTGWIPEAIIWLAIGVLFVGPLAFTGWMLSRPSRPTNAG